eukprot:TRINITY_DN23898_c0_g1_i1.p1 TRINITY_DN23898_c0_g1~~TRINITY_DN23898_c0_g1_i1.p1  ORF type:complete len:203 (-),score=40.95 TRINITY_DN23898_c0_g1_i1:379-987(-)
MVSVPTAFTSHCCNRAMADYRMPLTTLSSAQTASFEPSWPAMPRLLDDKLLHLLAMIMTVDSNEGPKRIGLKRKSTDQPPTKRHKDRDIVDHGLLDDDPFLADSAMLGQLLQREVQEELDAQEAPSKITTECYKDSVRLSIMELQEPVYQLVDGVVLDMKATYKRRGRVILTRLNGNICPDGRLKLRAALDQLIAIAGTVRS